VGCNCWVCQLVGLFGGGEQLVGLYSVGLHSLGLHLVGPAVRLAGRTP
jgi:hypothetical protein